MGYGTHLLLLLYSNYNIDKYMTHDALSIFSIYWSLKKTRRSEAKKILPKLENQNPTTSNPICLLSTLFKKNDALSETKILSTTTTTTTIITMVFMKDSKWNQGIDPTTKLFPTPSFTTRK